MNLSEEVTANRQIRLERRLPDYWRVTFDHPPLNIFGPAAIPQLDEIITAIECDEQLKSKVVAKEGAAHGVRSNVICPGFVRTPLVEKQIPEQAKALGITEQEVIKNVMLKETVDGQFTTVEDIAETALFFAAFPSNALTGQSLVVTHGWFME
jgi:enoyl-[acyl-carrier-protein] reductase (NADH)